MISTGDSKQAARNLLFLVEAGFIPDPDGKITTLAKTPQRIPLLPQTGADLRNLSDEAAAVLGDGDLLEVMTPVLIALIIIVLLLPNLIKLKLPGGIEAEIKEKESISSGPKGEIGFGSSQPISPGHAKRG